MTHLPWEDNLLERKPESDLKDLLKTLVAFANSVRPGHIAVVLIGETDTGIAQGVTNADNIQKKVRETCEKVYPPILWRSQVYEKDGKPCVRIEVEYSGETPHFGDAAWVRRGSVTEKASDEVFQRLVDYRLSKVRQLAEWANKVVTVTPDLELPKEYWRVPHMVDKPELRHPRWMEGEKSVIVFSVNAFWATFQHENGTMASEPLDKLVLTWDDKNNRPRILVRL